MGSATQFGTSLYVVKICLGAGLLGLPFALQESGLILGILAVAIACLLNAAACSMLLEARQMMDVLQSRPHSLKAVEPFARIAEFTIGKFGVNAVHASIVLTLLGAVAVYIIAITDITEALIPSAPPSVIPVVLVAVLLPFTFLRDLSFLSFASTGGTISYVISFIIIFTQGYMNHGFEFPSAMLWPQSIMSVLVAFGVLSFSLGVPVLTFAIQDSMQQPQSFMRVMNSVMVMIAFVYSAIAILGIGFYSRADDVYHHVQPNILANLPHSSGWTRLAQLSVLVTLMLTAPLSLAPALNLIEQRLCAALETDDSVEMQGLQSRSLQPNGYGSIAMDDPYHDVNDDDTVRLLQHSHHLLVQPSIHSPSSARRDTKGTFSRRLCELMAEYVIVFRPLCLILTAVIANIVPCFQLVMSAIGLLTLTLLCNIGPPLYWLRLAAMLDPAQRSLLPFSTGTGRRLYCQIFLVLGALLTFSGAVVISRASCA